MPDQCFVIMPYGSKKDATGRTVDFDALYRLLHAPAILQAGLSPIRSDQQQESGVIHKQLLEHLRDRAVVLADLSLHNPNVFYELGARHAMARRGTVLTCEEGTPLPFDVNLARVIKYRYDGVELRAQDLRAAEAELVAQLKAARSGQVDSPIHSLISLAPAAGKLERTGEKQRALLIKPYEALRLYPEELGRRWCEAKANYHSLFERHADSAFGSRALGYWWLEGADDFQLQSGREIAKALSGNEQFDLAHELYLKLEARRYDELGYKDFIYYGDAASEAEPTVKGTDEGFRCFKQARACIESTLESGAAEALSAIAWVDQRTASLQAWRWMLTNDERFSTRRFNCTSAPSRRTRARWRRPRTIMLAASHSATCACWRSSAREPATKMLPI